MIIKPYNTKQLAEIYKVTYKVMRTWLISLEGKIGKQSGKLWNIKQVDLIAENLGKPATREKFKNV